MNKRILLIIVTTAVFCACQLPPAPPNFDIRVKSKKYQTKVEMEIRGTGFTPNGHITVMIFDVPRREGPATRTTSAFADGTFVIWEDYGYRVVPRDEKFGNIKVTARDNVSGQFVARTTSSEPYVLRRIF